MGHIHRRVALLAVFVLAACAPLTLPGEADVAPAPQATVVGTPPAGNTYLERALRGEFRGRTVTVRGPATKAESGRLASSLQNFITLTGITIRVENAAGAQATLEEQLATSNPPDIAEFAQPGTLAKLAKSGQIINLNQYLNLGLVNQNYSSFWTAMATMDGPTGPVVAGIWERASAKSLVWYPKSVFTQAGYAVPTTWTALMALTDQIAQNGDVPWCIGLEAGADSGGTGTDWIEDILLRSVAPADYDRWQRGQLKFNSPEVRRAFQTLSTIWLNDRYVYGGRTSILTTEFSAAPQRLFSQPRPKCWLHRQGNFITNYLPSTTRAGTDYDFFVLPAIDAPYGQPLLVGGSIWAAFSSRPEVLAVMEYFGKAEHLKGWIQAGGVLSPHNDVNLTWYPNEVERRIAQTMQGAAVLRFDASDSMPDVVYAAFRRELISYVIGKQDLDTTLQKIDASWPQ